MTVSPNFSLYCSITVQRGFLSYFLWSLCVCVRRVAWLASVHGCLMNPASSVRITCSHSSHKEVISVDWSIACYFLTFLWCDTNGVSVQFSVLHRLNWSTDLQTLQNLKLPARWALFPVPFRFVSLNDSSGSHMYVEPPSVYLLLHLSSVCRHMCGGRRTVGRSRFPPGCFCLPVCILTGCFDHTVSVQFILVCDFLCFHTWPCSYPGPVAVRTSLRWGWCTDTSFWDHFLFRIQHNHPGGCQVTSRCCPFHVLIDHVDFLGKGHPGPCRV